LNDRRLLTELLGSFGIPQDQQSDALISIDKLDKIGAERVEKELEARGIHREASQKCVLFFKGIPSLPQSPQDGLEWLLGQVTDTQAARDLGKILGLSRSTAAADHIRIDPSLARGLSYYTGAIMEITVPDLAGSLGGGGRYDNLIGTFLGRDVPACGFSLGLERIIVVMTERNMFPPGVARGTVDVMVTIWDDAARADSLALAAELRSAGLRVDVYPEAEKPGKQLKYAATRRVPFVTIVGENERAQGNVSIKNLDSSEQNTVPRADAAAFIRRRLQERNG
jgi:histidyl-tRNA synthetase